MLVDAQIAASKGSVITLVARVASGDPAAEEELYELHRRGVAIIINQATGWSPAAEDLAQETFRIVFEKIKRGQLREPEKLKFFISSVAQNVVIDHFRKPKAPSAAGVDEAERIPDCAPSPLDRVLAHEQFAAIKRIILMVASKRERDILYRYYIEEEDKESICKDFGLTSLQFNLVLFRARKQFKKLYRKYADKASK